MQNFRISMLSRDIHQLAESRLLDYLSFKKISLPTGNIVQQNLNNLGFDVIDWGTLIGEIQCDCLRVLDWDRDWVEYTTLSDVIIAISDGETFETAIDIHHAMQRDIPVDEQIHHMKTALEVTWPR